MQNAGIVVSIGQKFFDEYRDVFMKKFLDKLRTVSFPGVSKEFEFGFVTIYCTIDNISLN